MDIKNFICAKVLLMSTIQELIEVPLQGYQRHQVPFSSKGFFDNSKKFDLVLLQPPKSPHSL